MHLADCKQLAEHAEWADASLWNLTVELGVDDAELRERLHHIHLVQWVYLQVWRGDPFEPRELDTFESLAEIHTWARGFYRELAEYLPTVTEAGLLAPMEFPWAEHITQRYGKIRPVAWQESFQQVILHTVHHRGQVTTRLRQLGAELPVTDFIAWLWMGRPAPEWAAGSLG